MGKIKNLRIVIICILIPAFLFGTMEVALKIGGASFDSLQLTFLRFIIGGIVLLPFAFKEYNEKFRSKGEKLTRKDWTWLTLVGIMCIPISMLAFQIGIANCNAATAASIICLNTVFTMIVAHLFTKEKMDKNKYLAVVMGFVALFFMIRPWDVQEGNTVFGLVMMLVASSAFGAYTVMGKQSLARIGTFTQTAASFIIGSIVLLVIMLFMGRPVFEGVMDHPWLVAYVGILVTGVGYLAYFIAIKHSDATTGSLVFFIKPAIAPFVAIIILHETIMWNTVVGIVLLISASFVTLLKPLDRLSK
ncbi:MAG: DMT family transporter [Firmicutes bacterium]|nr:DMT family transporter [Bacillota bacterium]